MGTKSEDLTGPAGYIMQKLIKVALERLQCSRQYILNFFFPPQNYPGREAIHTRCANFGGECMVNQKILGLVKS